MRLPKWLRRRDIVAEAFEDYRAMRMVHGKTVAEILAEDSEAAAQLRRDLEADTEIYLAEQWTAIHRRLARDRALRRAARAVFRDHSQT